jgi:hypothetical protein
LALSVPLSRFTSRVGGGSAFYVRRLFTPLGMRTLTFIVALSGVAWSLLMVSLAVPSLMAPPSAVRQREAVHTADQLLASAKASGQTNIVVTAQLLQPIFSGIQRGDTRTAELESGLLISAGVVFVLSIVLLFAIKKRV